ncbi:helix-turn-helix domain-containing protein [Paenibacillus flagellatus]|uniref:AraC family transcriptional regulator n=1 Tax=Paenibacillus flagellatus TaxID=2211139 RepID=A0A2V5L3I4_9BACL|nr:helix-turn-helix domain-containing protein [Paenibacillus flagellatus]PYI57396.1 AraC family transcriptional regulator [Paenibacillus flagellatus]
MFARWRDRVRTVPRYMKLLLAFGVLIGAVPVLALGLYSYYTASGDVEQKMKISTGQVLLQTQMRVEQMMKTLELTAMQYANSPQVTAALNGPLDVTDFTRVRNLYTGLYNLQTLSGMSGGYLVGTEHDWVMSFTSVTPLAQSPLARQLEQYAKRPNNLFWDIEPIAGSGGSGEMAAGVGADGGADTIRMVYKLPILPFTQQPKGFLIIEMLKSGFRSLLAADPERTGEVYALSREGADFLNMLDDPDGEYERINRRIAEAVSRPGASTGFLTEEVGGRKTIFSYRGSAYNGLIYVSEVSLEQLTRQTRKIAVATVVVCSAILAVVGILALLASRRMYSPIRRLAEFTKAVQIGETGGRDEFSSMEERFRTLFSTGQQMKQQMQGQFTQLNEFLMLKLFAGQLSERDFAYRSELYGFPSGWKRLAVLTLQIDTLHDTRYREEDKELLLFAIHNMVSELVPSGHRFSPVLLDQSQVTLITSELEDEAELRSYVHRYAEHIRAKVYEYLQVQVSIGVSRPFAKPTEAVRAYREGLEALNSRLLWGGGIIVHYGDVRTERGGAAAAAFAQLKAAEERLAKALKSDDPGKAVPLFDDYMTEIAERHIGANEYPILLMQLVARLYQVVQESGGHVHEVLGERGSYRQLMKRSTPDDIAEWFKRDLLGPIVDFLNRQAESQGVGIVARIVRLVEERYDRDITLEGIAEELHFHPVYLSRVFKKERGVTFSDYLAEYRMNVAKEWLETTTLRLSEIAEKLNYSNTTAFIRIFRKVVGMTPGQYRERCRQP